MGRKLYVGNFPYEVGETELQELFARAGTVETVKVMRDMATGRSRGFAFVEMSTDEEAQKAIADLNAHEMGGRGLTVNEARPPAYRWRWRWITRPATPVIAGRAALVGPAQQSAESRRRSRRRDCGTKGQHVETKRRPGTISERAKAQDASPPAHPGARR